MLLRQWLFIRSPPNEELEILIIFLMDIQVLHPILSNCPLAIVEAGLRFGVGWRVLLIDFQIYIAQMAVFGLPHAIVLSPLVGSIEHAVEVRLWSNLLLLEFQGRPWSLSLLYFIRTHLFVWTQGWNLHFGLGFINHGGLDCLGQGLVVDKTKLFT